MKLIFAALMFTATNAYAGSEPQLTSCFNDKGPEAVLKPCKLSEKPKDEIAQRDDQLEMMERQNKTREPSSVRAPR